MNKIKIQLPEMKPRYSTVKSHTHGDIVTTKHDITEKLITISTPDCDIVMSRDFYSTLNRKTIERIIDPYVLDIRRHSTDRIV